MTHAFKREENSGNGFENMTAKLDGNQEGNRDFNIRLRRKRSGRREAGKDRVSEFKLGNLRRRGSWSALGLTFNGKELSSCRRRILWATSAAGGPALTNTARRVSSTSVFGCSKWWVFVAQS